jgi:hypothetical protein
MTVLITAELYVLQKSGKLAARVTFNGEFFLLQTKTLIT